MSNLRKKHPVADDTHVLDDFPFLDNRLIVHNHVAKTFKDINACFELPCHEKGHYGHPPYERLCQKGNGEIFYAKICDQHRQVISATIKINSPRDVEINGFKPCIESMITYTSGAVQNFVTE